MNEGHELEVSGKEADNKSANVDAAIKKIAGKEPAKLVEMMAMQMSTGGSVLHQKMNADHISKVLEIAAYHDERQYNLHKQAQEFSKDDEKQNRIVFVIILLATVGLILTILFLFKDQPDVLVPSLTGVGGVIAGFLGGWGFGMSRKD